MHVTTSDLTEVWADFDPRAYLNEYYADMGDENIAFLRFFVRSFQALPADARLLDFGCGPTIFSIIAAVPKVREIHICDYLESNLQEVRKWLQAKEDAFDWREFIKTTLVLETEFLETEGLAKTEITEIAIRDREAATRDRVTRVMRCDASQLPPIADSLAAYEAIVSSSCAEAATEDYGTWRQYLRNIASLLKPGGLLVMSAVKGADFGSIEESLADGSQFFPTVCINERDLEQALTDADFDPTTIAIETVPADRPTRKYQGIMFATAVKRSPVKENE